MSCVSSEFIGVAFIIFVIITISASTRYFIKMFAFLLGSLVLAVAPVPLMLFKPRDYRNALIPAYGCVKLAKLLGVTFEVRGKENINVQHGSIVIVNHQSIIDLVVLAELWPIIGRATVVSKKEIFYLLPFGIASYLWGTLFIDRQDQKSARSAINKESRAINEKQAKILFFPEGTRGTGDALLPFKKGPFFVAIDSQCNIQPVVVSRYHFLDSPQKRFDRGQSIIKILPDIPTKGLSKEDIISLIDKTQKIMQTEYEKLTDESLAINNMKTL